MDRGRLGRIAVVAGVIVLIAVVLALATRGQPPPPAASSGEPAPVPGAIGSGAATPPVVADRGPTGRPPAHLEGETAAGALPPEHPALEPAPDERGQVSIQWLGQSMFYIQSPGQTVVVTDPFDPSFTGYSDPAARAHVVTISHAHRDHAAANRVSPFTAMGERAVAVVREGTYRRGDVTVTAVPAFHDAREGAERGPNQIFLVQAGGLRIVHLGDLGHLLTPEQVESLGRVDVLLIPVGGHFTIGAEDAERVVKQLNPRLVIPMHYRTPATDPAIGKLLRPVNDFTVRFPRVEFKDDYVALVAPNILPDKTTVWVLKYRGE
jgi:L-ascorbate metabolism protein UlaG (beta-lactamase superfamily)